MAELYPVIPGTVVEEVYCYWGPDPARYNADGNCSLTVGQSVTILWKEGDYYYIEYDVGGIKKRTYYMHDCIEIPYNIAMIPVEHEPSDDISNFRYAIADPVVNPNTDLNVLYAPNNSAPVAGSLSTLERVNFIATVGDFTLVDYEVTGQNGKRKRAWIHNNKITALPSPSGPIYIEYESNANTETELQANARYFYDCFRSLGFTPEATCAILGNIRQECSMDPALWEEQEKEDEETGDEYTVNVFGIFQWTPAEKYLNRAIQQGVIDAATKDEIQSFARSSAENLIKSQIECFLWDSFNGQWCVPVREEDRHTSNDMTTILQFKRSTLDTGTLAIVFHDHYEKSSDTLAFMQLTRMAYANDFYADFVSNQE